MELTNEMLAYLKKVTPGDMAIYSLKGEAFEPLYLSPGLPALNGMTMEEFRTAFGGNAAGAVLPADMPMLLDALHSCIETGKELDCYFRVRHKTLGYDWAHAKARLCGTMDGIPVFLVVYFNAPAETDLYRSVLDHSSNMAYVCDSNTYEILYANRAARESRREESELFFGKTCHAYIQGKDRPCANCFLKEVRRGKRCVKNAIIRSADAGSRSRESTSAGADTMRLSSSLPTSRKTNCGSRSFAICSARTIISFGRRASSMKRDRWTTGSTPRCS